MSKHKKSKAASLTFVSSIPDPPKARTKHDEIAAALRANPGKWAVVMQGPTTTMHAQKMHLTGKTRPGRDRAYGSGFTFEVRSDGYGTGRATLYARYDPPVLT